MSRIRTIKPEFPQSESVGKISRNARLLFIELWTVADDFGRSRAASRMLASLLFPYDDDAPGLIDGWLDELEENSFIRRYEADGSSYLEIINWLKHQRIDHPSQSRIPEFRESSRGLAKSSEVLAPRARAQDLGPRTMDLGTGPVPGPEESSLRSESSVSEKPIRTRKRKTSNSRIEYPPDFERFWRGYPTDSNMSKAEALREWEKLDAVDREAAERSLTGFRAYCSKNPDYRPVHAIRYLKLRRFDGHLSTNGHDGTPPALSEKEAVFRWWIDDNGMSREKAEERWEMILQRRQQHD